MAIQEHAGAYRGVREKCAAENYGRDLIRLYAGLMSPRSR